MGCHASMTTRRVILLLRLRRWWIPVYCCVAIIGQIGITDAFVPRLAASKFHGSDDGTLWTVLPTSSSSDTALQQSNRFDQELDENSRRRAAASRGGASGADVGAGLLLGGLLGGPFGALFGAQIGASLGNRRALDRARKEEMERMGLTEDMLKMAQEVGSDLERGIDGLKATRNSLETQQAFARRLSSNEEAIYEKAKLALDQGNEEEAKKYLFERQQLQQKLKKTLAACIEDKKRLETMENNVMLLEERAMEIEALLRRSVGAKTMQDTMGRDFSLSDEDPLLKKFRDAGLE